LLPHGATAAAPGVRAGTVVCAQANEDFSLLTRRVRQIQQPATRSCAQYVQVCWGYCCVRAGSLAEGELPLVAGLPLAPLCYVPRTLPAQAVK
jgi:hypothetical protein